MKKLLLSLLTTLTATVGASAATTYELTPITDLKTGDRVIIVDQTTANALPSTQATTNGSVKVSPVTLSADKSQITSEVTTGLMFTITVTDNGYQFTSCDNTTNMLYCIANNNGVRVAGSSAERNGYESFEWDATNNKLKNTGRTRWLGVYNKQDWRCYTSSGGNIANTVTAFYKEVVVVDDSKVATPEASVKSGVYFQPFDVTLSCETEEAVIEYSMDGENFTTYSAPISITETCTVTVKANKEGLTESDPLVLNYTIPELGLVGKGTEADPYTVADALKIIAYGPNSEEVYVKGIISTLTDISTQYRNATYDISDNGTATAGEQLTVFRGKYLNGADITDANKDEFQLGCEVVVKGSLINFNNTTPEIAQNNVLVSIKNPSAKLKPELSFAETAFTVVEDGDFTAPTLTNPHNLTVTYSTSDENIALVDENNGTVVIGVAGTATITATFEGDDTYAAGSASYTITVNPKPVLGAITVNGEVAEKDKTYPFVEGTGITFASENAEEIEVVIYTEDLDKVTTLTEVSSATWTPNTVGTYMVTVASMGCDDLKDIEFFLNITEKPAEIVYEGYNYVKVTSAEGLTDGGKYVLISKPFDSGKVHYGTYVISTAKSTNKGFDATEIDANATTVSNGYDLTEISHSILTLKAAATEGTWVLMLDDKYLDGSTKSSLKLSDTEKTATISFNETDGNVIITTGKDGTKDVTIQFYALNSSGQPANQAFNAYSSNQHPIYLYKRINIDAPIVEVGGEVQEDLDQSFDLQNDVLMLKLTAAEGHHIHYRWDLTGEQPSVVTRVAANETFNPHENNVFEMEISKSCKFYCYALHPESGLKSKMHTLTFVGEDPTSIDEIESATSAASEWFDLQGRRINRPAKGGVYIHKQGSTVSKRAL